MHHRKEIDGLRALAVVPVILFHGGFTTFSGGFVGVDIFFVISGFLITSIILTEKAAGRFSLVSFYERRARRILPALFVVMAACLPVAWLWLMPTDLKSFSQSLIAVTAFASNLLFWKTSGYFESSAELKPLLHTWSLAVEEQYYVIFPLALLLIWRLGKTRIRPALIVVLIASLAAAQWASGHEPDANFYLLPTRAWELLIGACVASYVFDAGTLRFSSLAHQLGSLAGLALTLYALFAFDRDTPFPSLYTLVPTVGVCLLLVFAVEGSWVGKLLGHRWLVGIGLISYSAYLWHQPLFAFAKYRSLDEPGRPLLGALAVAAVLLAYASWRYVEAPFRDRTRFTRRQIFVFAAVGSLFFASVGLAGHLTKGFEFRLTDEQRKISDYSHYNVDALYRRGTCLIEPGGTFRDFAPQCGPGPANDASLWVWGDSFAAALSGGLRTTHPDLAQYTSSLCPPVIGVALPYATHCKDVNDFVLNQIAELKPRWVLLHADWYIYEHGALARDVYKTIAAVRRVSPGTGVALIGSVPVWNPTLPIYAIRKRATLDHEQSLAMPNGAAIQGVDDALRALAAQQGAVFISPLDSLCSHGKCLAVVADPNGHQLTAWDRGHLTEAGSARLARQLEPEFVSKLKLRSP